MVGLSITFPNQMTKMIFTGLIYFLWSQLFTFVKFILPELSYLLSLYHFDVAYLTPLSDYLYKKNLKHMSVNC